NGAGLRSETASGRAVPGMGSRHHPQTPTRVAFGDHLWGQPPSPRSPDGRVPPAPSLSVVTQLCCLLCRSPDASEPLFCPTPLGHLFSGRIIFPGPPKRTTVSRSSRGADGRRDFTETLGGDH